MKAYVYLLIVFVLVIGCGDSMDSNPIDPVIPSDSTAIGTKADLLNAMDRTSYALFHKLLQIEESKNVLISPFSMNAALYMAMNGAREETLTEMSDVLNANNLNTTGLNQQYQEFSSDIVNSNSDVSYLDVHQSVFWTPLGITMDDNFRANMETYYASEMYDNDFTLSGINGWANEKTNGKIPKVLDKIRVDEVMFLLNAVYFKGDWEFPFDENMTRSQSFTTGDGKEIMTETMGLDYPISHFIGDVYSAVDLPFSNGEYAMTFIKSDADIFEFIQDMGVSGMQSMVADLVGSQLQEGRVFLSLPKFEISYKKEMTQLLKDLGMARAFDESLAQFQGFGRAGGNIYLSRVLHDTFLKIDEKGAEGAAVTTVGVGVESVPPPIAFDSPFMYIIRHIDSNVPIFMGICENPSE